MVEPVNILDEPTYSPILAARLVGLSPERVRRWLRGYEYRYEVGAGHHTRRGRQSPVVKRRGAAGSSYASFLDLIDLLFVKRFLAHGVTLQRLRQAMAEADRFLGGHHFAQRQFWTDGRNIYMQVNEKADALLHLLRNGQWAIAPVIVQTAQQIEFDEGTGFAERWFPMGGNQDVVVDPRVAFGAPSVRGYGVETSNVYDFFVAEGKRVDRVCSWMKLPESAVRSAVSFEKMLEAAA